MRHRVLLPKQAAELLPWYIQWSRDLAAEMHQRRLVWNEARRTLPSLTSYRPCDCASEWRCEPHDASMYVAIVQSFPIPVLWVSR